MGRGKQIAVIILILIMGFSCVYLGIQIKNRPEPVEEDAYQGSYKETSISLPVINESKGEEFLEVLRGVDGQIELFTILYNEDRTLVRGYKKYVLNSELKWDEAESEWMALEYFADTSLAVRLMAYAESGTLYFVIRDLAAEAPQCDEVMRFTASRELERVGVRGLYKKDGDGNPIQLTKLFISGNMVCITDELSNSYAYSLISGELFASGKNAATRCLACDGDYLYLLAEGCNAILPYSIASGDAAGTLKLWDRVTVWEDKESEYEIRDYQLLALNGFLYLSCQDGIFRYSQANGQWNLLLNGTSCIFGRPSIIQQSFLGNGEQFYMYGKDLDGASYLSMYSRRTEEEDSDLNLTDFTICAYRRNAIITEAVVTFQQENPSLNVIYDVALDKDPSLTVEEYQKSIQTAIASGKAADILVCDELDYNAYIASDFFENISDLMKPMYTSSNLYGNATNAMAQTKIFVTPAKIGAYFAYGNSATLEKLSSLADLKAFSEKSGSPALGTMTYRQLADLLSSFYQDEYVMDGKINSSAFEQALSSFPVIAKAVPSQQAASSAPEKEGDGASEALAVSDAKDDPEWFNAPITAENAAGPGITLISSLDDFKNMLSCLKEAGSGYATACGRFIPKNIVGINKSSKNIKAAREFIRTMYSESVQRSELGNGIPLRKSAIDSWSENPAIAEEDLDLLKDNLLSMNTVYSKNQELNAAISRVLELYLTEAVSLEEAVDQILNSMPAVTVFSPYEGAADSQNILFVGESFLEDGSVEESFAALCEFLGRSDTINSCIHSSQSLQEQLKYMESDSYKTYARIRNADIVFLQEKGDAQPDTAFAISQIVSYCKPESRIYYIMTHLEKDGDISARLSDIDRITIIPVGLLPTALAKEAGGLSEHSLLPEGRANKLYGYITALTAYEAAFGSLPNAIDAAEAVAQDFASLVAEEDAADDSAKQKAIRRLPAAIKKYCKEFLP